MIKKIFFLLAFSSILSCGKNDKKTDSMELNANLMEIVPEKNANKPPQPPKEEIPNTSSAVENSEKPILKITKKLVKNGKMNIAVSKIYEAKKEVEKILKKNDAYIQNETFQNSDKISITFLAYYLFQR